MCVGERWDLRKNEFPVLYEVASMFNVAQSTSVVCKRFFSIVSNTLTPRRRKLCDRKLCKMCLVKKWLDMDEE